MYAQDWFWHKLLLCGRNIIKIATKLWYKGFYFLCSMRSHSAGNFINKGYIHFVLWRTSWHRGTQAIHYGISLQCRHLQKQKRIRRKSYTVCRLWNSIYRVEYVHSLFTVVTKAAPWVVFYYLLCVNGTHLYLFFLTVCFWVAVVSKVLHL